MTDATRMAERAKITQLAEKARTWRLSGDHHKGADNQFPLIGYCFDNAYVAWHLYNRNDIDATIIAGTTERVADTLIQEDLKPREFDAVEDLAGHLHYWLEVETDHHGTMYVDIAADTDFHLGDCLVTETLPDDYIILSDSREEGQETLQNARERGDRCECCGGQKYDHGGCPVCYDKSTSDME